MDYNTLIRTKTRFLSFSVTVQNHEQLRSKPMQIRHSAKGLEQSKFTL